MKKNLLHILQTKSPHEEANIIANKEGLIALKNAIDAALLLGSNYTESFFHSDGEGYGIFIHLQENADCHVNSDMIPLPYKPMYIGKQREQYKWLVEEEGLILNKRI